LVIRSTSHRLFLTPKII
jgi:hypothetical protein